MKKWPNGKWQIILTRISTLNKSHLIGKPKGVLQPESYSEPNRTSKVELSEKIVND